MGLLDLRESLVSSERESSPKMEESRHSSQQPRATVSMLSSESDEGDKYTLSFTDEELPGGVDWIKTSFLIMAMIVGTGVLGLPQNFAKIGWLPGLVSLVMGGLSALVSGLLIHRCYMSTLNQATGRKTVSRMSSASEGFVIHPGSARPQSFGDIGEAAYGANGQKFAFWLSAVSIGCSLCTLQLVAGESLQRAVVSASESLSTSDFCQPYASAAVLTLTIPISQVRQLGALAVATVAGVTSIAVPLIIVFVHALTDPATEGNRTVVNQDTEWAPFLSNLIGGVAFAFSGQVLFPEFMHEMTSPEDFPKSVVLSTVVMMLIYGTVACFSYALLGDSVESPVTASVPAGVAGVAANLVLLFHVLVGFAISANAFNNIVFTRAFPDYIGSYTAAGRSRWLLVTVVTGASAYLIAEIMPNFGDFISVQGTTMGVFITYIIPSMCYVRLDNPQGKERVLVYCFAAYGVALMVAGTLGSVDDLITSLIDGASPFSCN